MSRLILASQSPRRLALLQQVGITPDLVLPADIDESVHKNELPRDYVLRVAKGKAEKIAKDYPGDIILAADTSVVVGRTVYGKAGDETEASFILKKLSGRRHRLISAIALSTPKGIRTKLVVTIVKFKTLSDADIKAYLATNEWRGVAGAYMIQGHAAGFITEIIGSYTNIVGLSLPETLVMLKNEKQ